MLRKIIEIISNPLLYYTDKNGNAVFRNYSILRETGFKYKTSITKQNIGHTLEYRFELDRYLHWAYFFITVILYFIFIHQNFSLLLLLFFEVVWAILTSVARLYISYVYQKYLLTHFGKYEVVEFRPPVKKEKIDEYIGLFGSRIVILLFLIGIYFLPSIIYPFVIKKSLTPKFGGYKRAISISNFYHHTYPKSAKIYDLRAVANYMERNWEQALSDYKNALKVSGKKFLPQDVVRFENLLLLQKKVTNPQDAIDIFNEYITQKNMTVLQKSQMLWIKSIFSIENGIYDSVMQDYEDLLDSLDKKDTKNMFYIACDKAYMMYLMQDYNMALEAYGILISYAESNKSDYEKELKNLYAERGWAKKRLGDENGANYDFMFSKIPSDELSQYEPSFKKQEFVIDEL